MIMVLTSLFDNSSPSSKYAIKDVMNVAVIVIETDTETGIRKIEIIVAIKEP